MYKISAAYLAGENAHFDFDYYFRVHVPLAEKQMRLGNVPYVKREVARNGQDLFDPAMPGPVLVLSYYLESKGDVDAFRAFSNTSLVQPLFEDVPNYTNCKLVWSIAEVEEL
jgi:uncharacterized protein (TIGR02118 family)